MTGISLTVLAAIYYPLGFFYFNSISIGGVFKIQSYKGISLTRGIGTFGAGLTFSILAIGVLFRLLMLPGAGEMIIIGLTTGILLVIVASVKFWRNNKSELLKGILTRSVIWIALAGILILTPKATLVKIFYRNHPEYVEAYEQAVMNPDDEELQYNLEKAREKLDN